MPKQNITSAVATSTNDALLAVTRITLGASATLAALLAAGVGDASIDAALARLVLIPATGATVNIRRDGTAAATTSYPAVPAGGIDFPIGAAAAALVRLVGSGSVDVWQFG